MSARRIGWASLVACTSLGLAYALHAIAAAPRPPLEIWGVVGGDDVTLDGAVASPKPNSTSRPFLGDPLVGGAPVTRELPAGAHSITVRLAGCSERSFRIELQGTSKRSIVMLPPVASHCQLPPPPPRAK